ncbi:hypothetical protein HZB06_01915 [Candidatus Wolfebacteria bacterium]|nr:hypothetical protein [Candidatus Wolfebacteria bacterium]
MPDKKSVIIRIMKIARQNFFTVLIVFTTGIVLAVALFGGNFMNHGADRSCIFSLIAGIDCLSIDRLAMINHIFSGWRSLTAAIVDFKTIILISSFLVFFLFNNDKTKLFLKNIFFLHRFYDLAPVSVQKRKFSRWLALHYGFY